MSSDIRLQALDTYLDDHPGFSGKKEFESDVPKKCIPKSENLLEESHDSQNNVSEFKERVYNPLDANYQRQAEKPETFHFGKEKRVDNSYKALIKDQEHFERLLHATRDQERNEGLKVFTDTFPQDPIVQRTWVKKIFNSILDLDGIIDKKTKYHNSSSQAARRIRDGYYPDLEIEKTAWRLMLNARDAQIGVRLVDKHHGIKAEGPILNGVGVFKSWADRMDAIINTLRVSKAACKQLMDPHYLDRLVECPNLERQMKKNNKRINTERDIQNQLGRKLLDLKVIPVADIEREAKKLQEIKEEHRLTAPPKTPRIKKECTYEEPSILSLSTGSTLARKHHSNVRKRKRVLRKKKALHINEMNTSSVENSLPEQFQSVSSQDYQRVNGVYRDSVTPIGLSPQTNMLVESSPPKINGILFNDTFNPNRMSIESSNPNDTESYILNPNQERQNSSCYQNNREILFQLDQNIDNFHTVLYIQPSVLDGSIQGSQSTIIAEPNTIRLYSEIICNILKVSDEYAIHFSLEDLRLYAHAYNSMFISCAWSHPDMGSHKARGCCVYDDEFTGHTYHIINHFPRLLSLAFNRGDIDQSLRMIPGTDLSHLFDTHGNELMDQALGVIPNACGSFLHPPPQLLKKSLY
ncbi:hypothetical protein OnM2_075020 [Erysiphe neolycopersici]|uniref:Uncharacterized protein n=1 Tax=Erysiphe neolycopersici TaxID=212602 RepID=A0A420HIG0_9PEZI|nr:hypothetical protein OnM2_075020 [Erysiphe neolycopersici]